MPFYAHTGIQPDRSDWQTLESHLQGVADLALAKCKAAFPNNTNLYDQVFVSAWLHDLGKYRLGFQDHIKGISVPRDASLHKQAGARYAGDKKHFAASFVIAGHHGGLPNLQDLKELLAAPPAIIGLEESLAVAEPTIQNRLDNLPNPPVIHDRMVAEVLIRQAFSLLVDADGEDTGKHEAQIHGWPVRNSAPKLDPARDLGMLLKYVEGRAARVANGPTKEARVLVLSSCLNSADKPQGIFSLQVPTGGGKTLSGMAFALKHAQKHGLRRIISVAPYLTILEQTAAVLRLALDRENDWDYVLEHHSLADSDSEGNDPNDQSFRKGRLGERWDSPVVITSNVQFWESLFGNKPGKCRKVHNIARSVILLDECQSIPPGFFGPICSMLQNLVDHFQCTVVLCTATQPAWSKRTNFPEGLENIQEIVPMDLGLYPLLNRTLVQWPTKEEKLTWEEVDQLVQAHRQALVMTNTRKAAKDLFELLQKKHPQSTFHLSTGLCADHRRLILETVQKRLADGKPCHLVSTQVLEAGVDIDFPVVFRELAPLEAVLQAAGRCNREGKLNEIGKPPGGKVRVFRSLDGKIPKDDWYKSGISIVEAIFLGSQRHPQPDDPELVEEYFKNLHAQGNLDKKGIQNMRLSFKFKDVAESFRLIEDGGYAVVVATWEPGAQRVKSLLAQAKSEHSGNARRRLASFQVNIRHYELGEHSAWITEEAPGLFVYRGPYDDHLGMLANPLADQLLII